MAVNFPASHRRYREIRQALRQLTQTTVGQVSQWPETVLSYDGVTDFPAFEAYRNELLPTRELELF